MTLFDFVNRFLNYKALIRVIDNYNSTVLFAGMAMDCPFRILRFTDIVRPEIDRGNEVLCVYVRSNSGMFNATTVFIDAPQ